MKSGLLLFTVACTLLVVEIRTAAILTGSGSLNYNPGTIYVQSQPAGQQVLVQVPQNVHVQSMQSSGQQIALIPINTAPTSSSFGDKLYNVFYGISNSIVSKTRTFGELLRSLCGRRPQYTPQYIIVNVPTTESTTTTDCHKTTESTTSTTTKSTTKSTTSKSKTTTEHHNERYNERCDDCSYED